MKTVILPIESSRASGRHLLSGIAKYSSIHSPWSVYWEPGGLEDVFPRLKNLNADGIIMRDSERLEEILDFGIPVIVVEHHYIKKIPNLVNIITDSKQIGRMAAEHLIQCGFKHFAFCGWGSMPWSIERCRSFCQPIEQEGHEVMVYQSPNKTTPLTWGEEQQHVIKWLRSLPKPVGLMTCNDDRSQQVLLACDLADIQVPEQVSIIGVDNDELICKLAKPTLSSISVNFKRAGYEAAQALHQLMEGQANVPKEILVRATHIVDRQSTDTTAIADAEVAAAVRFIRDHAKKPLRVDDVVAQTSLSRRVLEKRFRRCLNRTILEEIRRIRTNLISQMLVETNMSILEIAISLGFLGSEHIARYFQREKGMSLVDYRQLNGQK